MRSLNLKIRERAMEPVAVLTFPFSLHLSSLLRGAGLDRLAKSFHGCRVIYLVDVCISCAADAHLRVAYIGPV